MPAEELARPWQFQMARSILCVLTDVAMWVRAWVWMGCGHVEWTGIHLHLHTAVTVYVLLRARCNR